MSEQLDRVEAMLIVQGRMLAALADLALWAHASAPAKIKDEIRRAETDILPWRK